MGYNKGEAGRPLLIRLFGQHSFQPVLPQLADAGEYALKFLPTAPTRATTSFALERMPRRNVDQGLVRLRVTWNSRVSTRPVGDGFLIQLETLRPLGLPNHFGLAIRAWPPALDT